MLHVAESGGDIVGGNYNWLFTSGPSSSPWNNKWAGVNVTMNTIQNYTFNTGSDNNITLTNDKIYIVNWEDAGYMDSRAIFMETSAEPVEILSVSIPASPMPNTPYDIDITLNANPSAEEYFYVRYTIDNWTSSSVVEASLAGTTATVSIPGQSANTLVEYYAFSSMMSGLSADFSLYTLEFNNDGGNNFSYSIGTPPPPTIGWANLQWPPNGTINPGQSFTVYGQVYLAGVTDAPGQGAEIQAWVGWSNTDTDPATWTNWTPANFNVDVGNNDEYFADLGAAIPQSGTYYYATRFQYQSQDFVYGGFNGGFWDGTNNVSGELNVPPVIPLSNWSFVIFGLLLLTFLFIKIRK
jgi:hypothetical protein